MTDPCPVAPERGLSPAGHSSPVGCCGGVLGYGIFVASLKIRRARANNHQNSLRATAVLLIHTSPLGVASILCGNAGADGASEIYPRHNHSIFVCDNKRDLHHRAPRSLLHRFGPW